MEYPNSGALWRAKEKRNPKSPDMYGSIKIERDYLAELIKESDDSLVEIKLNGWGRETSSGNKFLSITVDTWKPKTESKPDTVVENNDDLPF